MVVLVNAYSGVLTSLLTVPKLEPIVNTLQELVEREDLGFGGVTIEIDSMVTKELLVNMSNFLIFLIVWKHNSYSYCLTRNI